jgi:hypothetical protein
MPFADSQIEGRRRAQHRMIGAGGSGKNDSNAIPAGNFTLSIMRVPPGQGGSAHTHEVEEAFFVLDGVLTVFFEDASTPRSRRFSSCPAQSRPSMRWAWSPRLRRPRRSRKPGEAISSVLARSCSRRRSNFSSRLAQSVAKPPHTARLTAGRRRLNGPRSRPFPGNNDRRCPSAPPALSRDATHP